MRRRFEPSHVEVVISDVNSRLNMLCAALGFWVLGHCVLLGFNQTLALLPMVKVVLFLMVNKTCLSNCHDFKCLFLQNVAADTC